MSNSYAQVSNCILDDSYNFTKKENDKVTLPLRSQQRRVVEVMERVAKEVGFEDISIVEERKFIFNDILHLNFAAGSYFFTLEDDKEMGLLSSFSEVKDRIAKISKYVDLILDEIAEPFPDEYPHHKDVRKVFKNIDIIEKTSLSIDNDILLVPTLRGIKNDDYLSSVYVYTKTNKVSLVFVAADSSFIFNEKEGNGDILINMNQFEPAEHLIELQKRVETISLQKMFGTPDINKQLRVIRSAIREEYECESGITLKI